MPETQITDHDALFSELTLGLDHEKTIRVKYQDIVYAICNLVDKARDDHRTARCTIENVVERFCGLLDVPGGPWQPCYIGQDAEETWFVPHDSERDKPSMTKEQCQHACDALNRLATKGEGEKNG